MRATIGKLLLQHVSQSCALLLEMFLLWARAADELGLVSYDSKHVTPELVAKRMVGLSFCTCCALLIDEVEEFSHKVSGNRQFKVIKVHADVEEQVGSYLLRC